MDVNSHMMRFRMEQMEENIDSDAEALVANIRERARNLYQTRQMLCTEAVVAALNHGLHGGLTDAQATAMAAPFSAALGDSGCLCGALSGAVMASGLLIGKDQPYRHRQDMRDSARQLHDTFKLANGATCCRVLSRTVKDDKKAHFQQCAGLTAQAAEMAARLVLRERPDLIAQADDGFLSRRQSVVSGALLRLVRLFSR
jgi:C_GCAxxG_C_C family probable redox protein